MVLCIDEAQKPPHYLMLKPIGFLRARGRSDVMLRRVSLACILTCLCLQYASQVLASQPTVYCRNNLFWYLLFGATCIFAIIPSSVFTCIGPFFVSKVSSWSLKSTLIFQG